MSNLTKNIIWAIITLIIVSLIFSYFVGPQTQPTTLNLNQVVDGHQRRNHQADKSERRRARYHDDQWQRGSRAERR